MATFLLLLSYLQMACGGVAKSFPMPNTLPTEPPAEAVVSPIVQSLAKSLYFKDDPVAQRIISGEMAYDMNDFGMICGYAPGMSDEYGYKVINGIKQLGYFITKNCSTGGDKTAILTLREFQERNGLLQSDFVDSETLRVLDKKLAIVEERDMSAIGFPCYKYITEAPPNDASRNHVAFLYMLAINAFPEELRLEGTECLNGQTWRVSNEFLGLKGDLCGYWYGYDDKCEIRDDPFEVWNCATNDYTIVQITIHEHAHHIDRNVGFNVLGTRKIDTTTFYDISYDIHDKFRGSNGWVFYRPIIDMNNTEQARKHFFSYGQGWRTSDRPGYFTACEDFAVCVEMYVLHGIEFRDYMKDKSPLARKYNWIKENVFGDIEFGTGDSDYRSYAPDLLNIGYGIFSAGGITELRPDYVWDYEIPRRTH